MSEPSSPRIREMPAAERPRERMERHGAGSLSDAELIAVFLRTGIKGKSAIDLGRELLKKFGSLNGLAQLDLGALKTVKGLGLSKSAQLIAALELAKRLAEQRASDESLDTPEAVARFLGPHIRHLPKESLRVVLLNTRLRLLKMEEIASGSHNECVAHPTHILRPAVQLAAHAVILAHNHPSGDPTPSEADRSLTRRLKQACEVLSLVFIDHIIIGRPGDDHPEGYYSFREHGLLG